MVTISLELSGFLCTGVFFHRLIWSLPTITQLTAINIKIKISWKLEDVESFWCCVFISDFAAFPISIG